MRARLSKKLAMDMQEIKDENIRLADWEREDRPGMILSQQREQTGNRTYHREGMRL
jgi:hypothetical protein